MIRVGVIGCGEMGQHHVRNYSEMEDVELVGIADPSDERISTLSKIYKTQAFNDYTDLLKQDLDAVNIAVPTTLHTKISLDAIKKGTNLLVEKPIADTIKNADLMINAAEKNNLKLMVGHIERFSPAIIAVKKYQEDLGEIVSMSSIRVGPYNPRIRDVGIITDLGVHDIDIMSYVYGKKVSSVHAYAGSVFHRFEDYANILLGFDGNSGAIELNWLTPHKTRKLSITGRNGIAYVNYIKQSLRVYREKGETNINVEKKEPLRSELEHFIGCLKKDKKPAVDGDVGRHTLHVAMAAIESYKKGRAIRIK